jgi:hypothetical protein
VEQLRLTEELVRHLARVSASILEYLEEVENRLMRQHLALASGVDLTFSIIIIINLHGERVGAILLDG